MAEPLDPLGISRKYWTDALGDSSQFFAMTAVLRLARRIGESVDAVLKSHGINRNGYLILMSLQLSGSGWMIIGRLAEELVVHPTTATLTIDKLEADGLVAKAPHETDGRAIKAVITKAGRRLATKVTADLADVGFGLGNLSKSQTTKLTEAVKSARRAVGDIRN